MNPLHYAQGERVLVTPCVEREPMLKTKLSNVTRIARLRETSVLQLKGLDALAELFGLEVCAWVCRARNLCPGDG